MQEYQLAPVNEEHNEQMLSILKSSPIEANGLTIFFDKQPDAFAISKIKYEHARHLGLFSGNSLKAFGTLGYYEAMVNGKPEYIFYLSSLYALPETKGSKFVFNATNKFFSEDFKNASVGFAVTMKGNKPTEKMVGKQPLSNIPFSKTIDSLVVKNILFAGARKNKTSYIVRKAGSSDIPSIVNLLKAEHDSRLFGNVINEQNFLQSIKKNHGFRLSDFYVAINKDGEIAGTAAAWDCSTFRQTRVIGYSKRFVLKKIFYKFITPLFSMTPLPRPGEYFKELTITNYAVKNRDPQIMRALLVGIYNDNRKKGFHFMNWGSCGTDPILEAANCFWYTNIVSHIIMIARDASKLEIDVSLPYVDLALL